MKLLFAAFVAAHALIHGSYLTPEPRRIADGPEWPFAMARSWLVTAVDMDPAVVRVMGVSLVTATIVLLVAGALATAGAIVPPTFAVPLLVSGAAASAVTLALFFHPWILLGFLIDALIAWIALSGWGPMAELAGG